MDLCGATRGCPPSIRHACPARAARARSRRRDRIYRFHGRHAGQGLLFLGGYDWCEGVAEAARRFKLQAAILNLGAVRVPEGGPFHLTMTAKEAVEAARAFSGAAIVPLHFEGWAHFSEGREEIAQAFSDAGLSHRLRWPEPGRFIQIDL